MEIEVEDLGVLLKIIYGNGDVVFVIEIIGYIGVEGEEVIEVFFFENILVEENVI